MKNWVRDKRVLAAVLVAALVTITVLTVTGVLSGFLLTLFIWPSGIVVGNLIASALWQPSWFLSLHKKTNTQTKVLSAQAEKHHQEKMAQAERHHQELKTHITNAVKTT